MKMHKTRSWTRLVTLALATAAVFAAPRQAEAVPAAFAEQLDLQAIRQIAVQDQGRLKTFDTLAREVIYQIAHTETFEGQDPVLTYLDLMLAPETYQAREIIYLGKYALRQELARRLNDSLTTAELLKIEDDGRVSPQFIDRPEVQQALAEMKGDVRRFYQAVESVQLSRDACRGQILRFRFSAIPPPGGEAEDRWHPVEFLHQMSMPDDSAHAGLQRPLSIPGLDAAKSNQLRATWSRLATAWKTGNATEAGNALNELSAVLPTIEPALYPSDTRRAVERWYISGKTLFWSNNKMTWTWVVYLASFVLLLMAFVYRWPRARRVGLTVFGLAFALHSVGVGIRWYLQERIPNANMFEAVTMSVWFGAGVCIVLEFIFRRTDMRNLFALAASAAAMFALMAGYFLPVTLGANMSVMMPVLDTIWLRIHTNLIIASYALIGIATTTAVVYLVWRLITQPRFGVMAALAVPTVFFLVGMSDAVGFTHAFSSENARMIGAVLSVTTPFALIFIPVVLIAPLRVLFPALLRAGQPQLALAGGGSVPVSGGATPRNGDRVKAAPTPSNLAQVLDGATMILMQLSFVTLWVGLILGAVWADVSWGRPWGWDPKEVFALNTWIIFLILVHVRMKVRDKAFWTAMLCVAGCSVMLFNWIAINFVITGLHSYAS